MRGQHDFKSPLKYVRLIFEISLLNRFEIAFSNQFILSKVYSLVLAYERLIEFN